MPLALPRNGIGQSPTRNLRMAPLKNLESYRKCSAVSKATRGRVLPSHSLVAETASNKKGEEIDLRIKKSNVAEPSLRS